MKYIVFTLLLFYSNLTLSQETEFCNKLECMDDDFKKKNFVKYYTVLNKTLIDARGCNDNKKLDNVLEFTSKITNVDTRERMAKFIENEFINNPTCILSAIKRISQDARYKTSRYLAKPIYVNGQKIKSILDGYQKQYPKETYLIFTGKELSNSM